MVVKRLTAPLSAILLLVGFNYGVWAVGCAKGETGADRTARSAQLSGRRWRARALATVRRSNCTCSFPAYSFPEDSIPLSCDGRN